MDFNTYHKYRGRNVSFACNKRDSPSQKPPRMPRADTTSSDLSQILPTFTTSSELGRILPTLFSDSSSVDFLPPTSVASPSLPSEATNTRPTATTQSTSTSHITNTTNVGPVITAVDNPSTTSDQGQEVQTLSPSDTSSSLSAPSATRTTSSQTSKLDSSISQSQLSPSKLSTTSQSTTTTVAPTTSLGSTPSEPPGSPHRTNIGLISGLAIGLTLLILLLLLLCWRRGKHNTRRLQESVNMMPHPLSPSARPTEKGSDSKGSALAPLTTSNTQASSNSIANAVREKPRSALSSSEIPNDTRSARAYPQPLDPEGGERPERSGVSSPVVSTDFTMDVDNVQVLRAQLTAALRRLEVLEPGEEAPPDYVSSASR
ncbi:hypothetical protein PM082_004466 [Marasmius tenuissimus]|nr:hypothetical protein PM082_004466 [Marasmius tenuissimus]